jgi:hypothetical protein
MSAACTYPLRTSLPDIGERKERAEVAWVFNDKNTPTAALPPSRRCSFLANVPSVPSFYHSAFPLFLFLGDLLLPSIFRTPALFISLCVSHARTHARTRNGQVARGNIPPFSIIILKQICAPSTQGKKN